MWNQPALLSHLTGVLDRHGWVDRSPVVAGFSWGASTAVRLAASGLRTRALLLFHGTAEVDPGARLQLPVLVQSADRDPLLPVEDLDIACRQMESVGAQVTTVLHAADAHLFTDEDHADHRPDAATAA